MKCDECGYDHKEVLKHWEYRGESNNDGFTYTILSNTYDGEILKEILSHSLSLHKPPFDLFIDTCVVETHGCKNCFLEYLRSAEERRRIEQQFFDLGITLHEFF
ncbi:hypothetical protein DS745_03335 [Anaerobacillus alkaliphilus]|uniref:Uncharacterized protein n=1 Tax=Anaerobacillus alkaliphilus TaxID=1548597 RepID=A0A4Q0VYF0_9BACI|nr:hypothetical protein [Anaerobacillus alkaliphilus]RXJ04432.1 hypothetical protein DS745_03335 [Anaerobacillus alkaliphilus]